MSFYSPAYPVVENESWKILTTEFESGVEQVIQKACYSNREWDLTYRSKVGSGQVDYLRDFIHRHQKESRPFMWKEIKKTSRDHVKLGHGNGSRKTWLLPLIDVNSVTVFINSLSTGYSLLSGGTASLGIVSIQLAPAYSDTLTFSYRDCHYCPMVVMRDVFQYNLQAYPNYGEIMFTLRETKTDYPAA